MKKQFLGNTGDRDWLGCGGTLVIKNRFGEVEAFHVDTWRIDCGEVEDEYSKDMLWDVHQFEIDKLYYVCDTLVDEYGNEEWFSNHLDKVSENMGIEKEELINAFCSDNPMSRAYAYDAVGSYFGFVELDNYPQTLNRKEMYNLFRVAW